jgi:hypothetical protein
VTAIRNFPDSPLARRQAQPIAWKVPSFALKVWEALFRFGQQRAARELDLLADRRALADPVLARQLRAAASEYRKSAQRPPVSH